MKYLKEFSTESEYLTYRDSSSYLKPNVSLLDDNGKVFYNFTPPPIVYEAVDLGLPSGTKWASQNVGARKPSDAGLYFQWGDTSGYTADQVGTGDGQKNFNWRDYKWSINGSPSKFSKYTTPGATLELEDDAAHVNMGGEWHMPTDEQIQELIDNTTSKYAELDNVKGRMLTSNSTPSRSIFIPAAGYAYDGSVVGVGDEADVWSSVLNTPSSWGNALKYDKSSSKVRKSSTHRCVGLSVRGVIG